MISQNVRVVLAVFACLSLASSTTMVRAQSAQPQVTKEQDKLARDFARGRAPASEEAKRALFLKIKQEMDRLKVGKEDLVKVADYRSNIENTWLVGARDPVARQVAVQSIAGYAKQMLADPQLPPAVKINCMAMLSELDDAPGTDGIPNPSADAFATLYAAAGSENLPVYLRAIALHGMHRQVGRWWPTTRWNDNGKQAIVGMLAKVVSSEPKTELDLQSHAWLVRRAYDCLGTIASTAGAASALQRLGDPKTLPSVRLSALEYLARLETSQFPEDKKNEYLISAAHFLRSQLVDWYEREDDILRAKSGAGGMMGGMGMGMEGGMGYGGDGGYGGGAGMGYGGEGGMGGMGYGGDGGMGYGGGTSSKPKPIDTQTWQTRKARRLVNQITQAVHSAFAGTLLPDSRPVAGVRPLTEAGLSSEASSKLNELIETLGDLQAAVNDPVRVTDINSLLTQAEGVIEDIMDMVKEIPGFLDRYPELIPDDELPTVAPRTAPSSDSPVSDSDDFEDASQAAAG